MFLWRHDKIVHTQKCYHHNVSTEEESYNGRNKNIEHEYYVSMFILKKWHLPTNTEHILQNKKRPTYVITSTDCMGKIAVLV